MVFSTSDRSRSFKKSLLAKRLLTSMQIKRMCKSGTGISVSDGSEVFDPAGKYGQRSRKKIYFIGVIEIAENNSGSQ